LIEICDVTWQGNISLNCQPNPESLSQMAKSNPVSDICEVIAIGALRELPEARDSD
jgi:hypothetical protein